MNTRQLDLNALYNVTAYNVTAIPTAYRKNHTVNARKLVRAQELARRLRPAVIALDGPTASGKSTIGMRVADAVDYLFFDTGAMYRAVTWAVLDQGISVEDSQAVGQLVAELTIDVAPPSKDETAEGTARVFVEGQDVTEQLRTHAVNRHVSIISAIPAVRNALSMQQRMIAKRFANGGAERRGIVMAGRDIGTVIVPEARFKVFLDASVEERANRRYQEQVGIGDQTPYAIVLADIRKRDQLDQERSLSPLRPADDALVIDTSEMDVDGVVTRILELFVAHVAPIVDGPFRSEEDTS